jgi:hypothetical protein
MCIANIHRGRPHVKIPIMTRHPLKTTTCVFLHTHIQTSQRRTKGTHTHNLMHRLHLSLLPSTHSMKYAMHDMGRLLVVDRDTHNTCKHKHVQYTHAHHSFFFIGPYLNRQTIRQGEGRGERLGRTRAHTHTRTYFQH